jgi:hypothetical protein
LGLEAEIEVRIGADDVLLVAPNIPVFNIIEHFLRNGLACAVHREAMINAQVFLGVKIIAVEITIIRAHEFKIVAFDIAGTGKIKVCQRFCSL